MNSILLISKLLDQLQEMLNVMNNLSSKLHLKMNRNKIKLIFNVNVLKKDKKKIEYTELEEDQNNVLS